MLFLPLFGTGPGVPTVFFRMTIVTGDSTWPVVGAFDAALVLGVFGGIFCKIINRFPK